MADSQRLCYILSKYLVMTVVQHHSLQHGEQPGAITSPYYTYRIH